MSYYEELITKMTDTGDMPGVMHLVKWIQRTEGKNDAIAGLLVELGDKMSKSNKRREATQLYLAAQDISQSDETRETAAGRVNQIQRPRPEPKAEPEDVPPQPRTRRQLKVFPDTNRIIVEKVNLIKRHTRASKDVPQGGIIEKEAPINASNVMLVCPNTGKPTRIGKDILSDGSRARVSKKSGEMLND